MQAAEGGDVETDDMEKRGKRQAKQKPSTGPSTRSDNVVPLRRPTTSAVSPVAEAHIDPEDPGPTAA